MNLCFPAKFGNAGQLNHFVRMREKILAETGYILSDDVKYLDEVRRITEIFVSLVQPKNLDGDNHKNPIIQFRLDFEELCIALQVHGIAEPQQMNVFQFYTALKYFEAKKTKQPK